ncbi:hypothetical protein EMIHUDRAFT_448163 [Emiliania huxleyi CCMP1516]|uniref:Uncharacterized protein n=2 Tax=Emiliania huxleyi TaxID=2903 RepID=A0A0D3ITS4_EMIH1|nr:hypothetical protein EMIHUDRAFT_448163 [Emiliania huxleyi CCMP1516]EOD14659.1 hypothetical protein EMIHUDRAFT_448163 [Emiliania huxleyi CCMP1516]|eukprot:XP_005767088.1 hypothetical protein EMIHUDRAFT_448163 [Emiliania huxleyi CCMP1516]
MASPLLRRCVQIDGLKSRPELNGSFGSALNFDALANRYQVIVGVKRSFAIKADNLHDVASVRYRALEERAQKRVDTVRAMLEAGEEAPLEDVAEGSSALQVLTLLSAGWACADSLLANQAVSRLTAMGPAGPESAALQPLVACDAASHAGLCGLVDAMIVQKVGRLPFRAMYDLLCDIACGYQLSNIAGKSGLAGVDMFDCTSMQGMDTLMQKCAGDPKKMLEMLQTSMEVSKSAAAWSTSAAGLACKRMLGAVGAVDLAVRYVSEYAALLDGGLLDATRAEHGEEAANSVEFFMRLPAYASCNLLKLLLRVGTAALAQQTVHLLVKERLAAEARKEAGEEEEADAAEKMTPMMLQDGFVK